MKANVDPAGLKARNLQKERKKPNGHFISAGPLWVCCAEWLYYYLKNQAETRRFERRPFVGEGLRKPFVNEGLSLETTNFCMFFKVVI
jgi:hypothetical protein